MTIRDIQTVTTVDVEASAMARAKNKIYRIYIRMKMNKKT